MDEMINALNCVKRIRAFWIETKPPIPEISFTGAIKACENAKLYSAAVKLRAMENYFVTNDEETKARFDRIVNEIEGTINADRIRANEQKGQQIKKHRSTSTISMAGNPSADKRIND